MSLHRPFVVALLVVLTGCGAMRPTQPPAALTCNLTNYEAKDIYEQWRMYRATMSRPRAVQDQRPSFNVLSLSAGGEFGAYGAGFLVGWDSVGSQALPGPRRDIQVVTGVSTGAILATHVFLGLDKEIEAAYRSLSGQQLYRSREIFEYLRANSLLDTTGKDQIIDENLTSEIIDQVAAQEGRFLYIGIVSLDSGEFLRIDMVKLARELKPKETRDLCFKAVIGASSAIPIAFSPKFIDKTMWVDGGTRRHLFITQPPTEAMQPNVNRRLYSFVHGDLSVRREEVKNGVLQIAGRTAEVFIDQGLKDSIRLQEDLASTCPPGTDCGPSKRLFSTYYASAAAAASACAPTLQNCSPTGGVAPDDMFCNAFMNCLADAGRRDGRDFGTGIRDWLSLGDLCLGSAPDCTAPPGIRPRLSQ